MTEADRSPFGQFLKNALDASPLTRTEVAEAVGITPRWLGVLEKGYRPESGGMRPVPYKRRLIVALSRVLNFPLQPALELAGLPQVGQAEPASGLAVWSVDELLYEVRARFDELSAVAEDSEDEETIAATPTRRERMSIAQVTARTATVDALRDLAEARRAEDEEGATEIAQLAFDLNRQMVASAATEEAEALRRTQDAPIPEKPANGTPAR